jgi:hypothetical protein
MNDSVFKCGREMFSRSYSRNGSAVMCFCLCWSSYNLCINWLSEGGVPSVLFSLLLRFFKRLFWQSNCEWRHIYRVPTCIAVYGAFAQTAVVVEYVTVIVLSHYCCLWSFCTKGLTDGVCYACCISTCTAVIGLLHQLYYWRRQLIL